MRRLLFLLVLLVAVSGCSALAIGNSLDHDREMAKACAPRCVCGPPGEYTWCCACPHGGMLPKR